jgi:predicted DNA-binding transcriptional regulator AlpA
MPQKQPTIGQLFKTVADLKEAVLNQPRLHRKDLMLRYGWSESTLHRNLRRGLLPKPVRFSGPLWRPQDLEQAELAGQLPKPKH